MPAKKLEFLRSALNVHRAKESFQSLGNEQKLLLEEALKRLGYMQFALEKIEELQTILLVPTETDPILLKLSNEGKVSEEELHEFWKRNPVEDFQRKQELWDQLTFYTESFYFQAHRCGKCIENIESIPAFNKRKYPGVKVVRNLLIEHPEVLTSSIMLGTDTGPVLKNARVEDEINVPQDKGLNHNASEFLDNALESLNTE